MAAIIYFTRMPRYKNTTIEEVFLVEKYFAWQKNLHRCNTFEKWCRRSESELPPKDVIEYYKPFFTKKTKYVEMAGQMETTSITEQVIRFCKANAIFNWAINNIMDKQMNSKYYEVTQSQLESLFENCKKIKNDGMKFVKEGIPGIPESDEYNIDEEMAKQLLPTSSEIGGFFGPYNYDSWYAYYVIQFANFLKEILDTTDFEKQMVFVNFGSV